MCRGIQGYPHGIFWRLHVLYQQVLTAMAARVLTGMAARRVFSFSVLFILLLAFYIRQFKRIRAYEALIDLSYRTRDSEDDQDIRESVRLLFNSKLARENVRHVGFVLLRGKGYFASRINRYANSTSCFQLVRLVACGSISPNPGPENTSALANSGRQRSRPKVCNIKIAHLNIRSLKNREHYILAKETVLVNKLDIFTVSESWLDNTVSDIEVEFPGFNIYRLDREIKIGGGVCVFVKQDFKVECLQDLSFIAESGLHMLWVKIQIRNLKSFLICTVYRPPNTSTTCFDTDLSVTLIEALSFNKPIFILGDLNCNVLNANDPACQALTNFCSSFNLSQLINQPTRVTETSETLIDVLLASNRNMVIETKVIPVSISDHDLICATLKLKKERPKPVYVSVRSFKHYNHEALLKDMSKAPWSVIDCFDNVDDSVDSSNLLLNDILDHHAPIRKIRLRNRPNPFVTDEIRELMKTRDQWRKLARKTKVPLAWSGYKTFKREVKRELKD